METRISHKTSGGLGSVPPSGGSLEIGNSLVVGRTSLDSSVPPSGGSLEIGNTVFIPESHCVHFGRSPFGGIPRNWKQLFVLQSVQDLVGLFPLRGDP